MVSRPDNGAARAALAGGPRGVPLDVNLFSSNVLFGQPGIYPRGIPMQPAAGTPVDTELARDQVLTVGGPPARKVFDAEPWIHAVPNPAIRAGLALLKATLAAPLLDDLPTLNLPRTFGTPTAPGRVIGDDEHGQRVVNARYENEHPALLALSLTHDLLWSGPTAPQAEEATLHALGAMVHLQLIVRMPTIAHTGTELARRQNSLAVTLLESRAVGKTAFRAREPKGGGTIPGGNPHLASVDFWSIPFVSQGPVTGPAPSRLSRPLVHAGVIEPSVRVPTYEDRVGDWLASDRGTWFPLVDHVRVAVALGTLPVVELAAATNETVDAVVHRFGLRDAVAPFL